MKPKNKVEISIYTEGVFGYSHVYIADVEEWNSREKVVEFLHNKGFGMELFVDRVKRDKDGSLIVQYVNGVKAVIQEYI